MFGDSCSSKSVRGRCRNLVSRSRKEQLFAFLDNVLPKPSAIGRNIMRVNMIAKIFRFFFWYANNVLFAILDISGVYKKIAKPFPLSRFNDKKILILGSGPSLVSFKEVDQTRFDFIIAINQAVNVLEGLGLPERYYFSCDVKFTVSLIRESCLNVPMILVPMQTNHPIRLGKLLGMENTFANFPKYKFHLREFNIYPYRLPAYSVNLDNQPGLVTSANDPVPVFPYSSVFTLLNILLNEKAHSVSLLGIDLSGIYGTPEIISLMESFQGEYARNGIPLFRKIAA